jgi:hypothetical protein
MKHYAGLDLSMETTHVCVVDVDGRKIGAQCVESTPEAIATALASWASRSSASTPVRHIRA